MTRRQAARDRLTRELEACLDQRADAGVAELVRVLVALRDAPLPDGVAIALGRRAPAFTLAYARACELADELEERE